MATARSQTRLSNPGEPEIILPGGTSCETADCAVRMTPSPKAAVPRDARLPGENYVVADDRGTSQADLRAEQGVLSNARAVAHLHEVVDLCAAADFGGAHGGAIDAGVGLNVHAVAEPDGAGLRNFLPLAGVVLRKTKTVGADDGSVFKRDVVAQNAAFAHHRVRMGKKVAACGDSRVEDHVRQAAWHADQASPRVR